MEVEHLTFGAMGGRLGQNCGLMPRASLKSEVLDLNSLGMRQLNFLAWIYQQFWWYNFYLWFIVPVQHWRGDQPVRRSSIKQHLPNCQVQVNNNSSPVVVVKSFCKCATYYIVQKYGLKWVLAVCWAAVGAVCQHHRQRVPSIPPWRAWWGYWQRRGRKMEGQRTLRYVVVLF